MNATALHDRPGPHPDAAFRHEAFFYAGESGFVSGATDFIRDGLDADERTLVVVSAERIAVLRAELGADADEVWFADMASVGLNPARIIPVWRDFVAGGRAAGACRGIGEPIWASRTPAEMAECQRHEALLNVAFADTPGFFLLCPYDVETLPPPVLAEAERSHPLIRDDAAERDSTLYPGLPSMAAPFTAPLPDPPADAEVLMFDAGPLSEGRRFVSKRAVAAGLTSAQVADLVLAVNELATNSIRYGGGAGTLRMWTEAASVVCEVADAGYIEDPLAGRVRPTTDRTGGRGLWLVNQLCDLVQLRSSGAGTVVRLHMRRP